MKNSFLTAALLLVANLVSAQCPKLVWADEFDGNQLDNTKWTAQIGQGCDNFGNCGWGNNELQYYRAENASVSNGTLKIQARKENFDRSSYTSSRLRTINKGDFKYGRMEARMKMPIGRGIWPAFWMLNTDDPRWPQGGEIDIMEYLGHEPDIVYGTVHFGPAWPNNRSISGNFKKLNEDYAQNFHVYAVEWEMDEIRWYIDDVLYTSVKRSQLAPNPWPFDSRFHIILNLAVGGNWPGNPNSSTVFPQNFEVDYVRVYDGNFTQIRGNQRVAFKAPAESYTLSNAPVGASVTWTVPAGTQITSGQGTPNLNVKWGDKAGEISASFKTACGDKTLKIPVLMSPDFSRAASLENFDEASPLNMTFSNGNFTDNFANPAKNAINSSNLCARYVRNGASQYDVIVYSGTPLADVGPFVRKERKFFIDLYTTAPLGTEILFQLENSSRATAAYPAGRHSRYRAYTGKQNEWERLELTFLDQPDPSVAHTVINSFVLLLAPNTLTSHVYHLDNLDVFSAISTSVETVDAEKVMRIFPNPSNRGEVQLENRYGSPIAQVQVLSMDGKLLYEDRQSILPKQTRQLSLSNLPAGTYWTKVFLNDGKISTGKLVIY
jgi:beta-glucanase (GH16 family)